MKTTTTNKITVWTWIIDRVSGSVYQSHLVEDMLKQGVFDYGDIRHLRKDDYVFNWVLFPFIESYEWLENSGLVYLENDYGVWIGRTDHGSGDEYQFLPEIISAYLRIKFTHEHYAEFKKHWKNSDSFNVEFEKVGNAVYEIVRYDDENNNDDEEWEREWTGSSLGDGLVRLDEYRDEYAGYRFELLKNGIKVNE